MSRRKRRVSRGDDWDLTPAQLRDLKRRIKDMDDPIRYSIASEYGRKFILYYNVSDDMFAQNDPSGGTLFKRRAAAESIKKLLRPTATIVKFTTKRGKLRRVSPFRGGTLERLARSYRKQRRSQTQPRGRRKSA